MAAQTVKPGLNRWNCFMLSFKEDEKVLVAFLKTLREFSVEVFLYFV